MVKCPGGFGGHLSPYGPTWLQGPRRTPQLGGPWYMSCPFLSMQGGHPHWAEDGRCPLAEIQLFLSDPGWVAQARSKSLSPDVLIKEDAQAAARGPAASCLAPKGSTEDASSSPESQRAFLKAWLDTWAPDSSSAPRPCPTQAAFWRPRKAGHALHLCPASLGDSVTGEEPQVRLFLVQRGQRPWATESCPPEPQSQLPEFFRLHAPGPPWLTSCSQTRPSLPGQHCGVSGQA